MPALVSTEPSLQGGLLRDGHLALRAWVGPKAEGEAGPGGAGEGPRVLRTKDGAGTMQACGWSSMLGAGPKWDGWASSEPWPQVACGAVGHAEG